MVFDQSNRNVTNTKKQGVHPDLLNPVLPLPPGLTIITVHSQQIKC